MLLLKNIKKKFGNDVLFDDLNLSIEDGAITCLLGASGVGKTTLLKMISSLVSFEGEILNVPDKISYIFQEPRLLPNLTVIENLCFAAPNASKEKIQSILEMLELSGKANSYPRILSGGEAQRVSIARAFLYDGDLILMDEGFSSLDLSLKLRLIQSFSKLWLEQKKTVLFVTHDIDEALLLAHKIHILRGGRICKSYEVEMPLPRTIGQEGELRTIIIEELIKEE